MARLPLPTTPINNARRAIPVAPPPAPEPIPEQLPSIYEEFLAIVGEDFAPQGAREPADTYLARLAEAAQGVDDDTWSSLSDEARAWFEQGVIEAMTAQPRQPIPLPDGYVDPTAKKAPVVRAPGRPAVAAPAHPTVAAPTNGATRPTPPAMKPAPAVANTFRPAPPKAPKPAPVVEEKPKRVRNGALDFVIRSALSFPYENLATANKDDLLARCVENGRDDINPATASVTLMTIKKVMAAAVEYGWQPPA
jgi:hypothetical protein